MNTKQAFERRKISLLILALFTSFTFASVYDFYQSCEPVSECLSEEGLKNEYLNLLNQYRGTSDLKSQLLELSQKRYSQRLECSMSEFLESNSSQPTNFICDSPSAHLMDSLERITNPIEEHLHAHSPSEPIDPICFHASSLRGIKAVDQRYECFHYEQMNFPRKIACAEGHSKCKSNPTSGPCLSSTYFQKMAQVFDQVASCANLTPTDKQNLFTIINHESAFMPNAKSSTGTRCMGQLTGILANELTARLASGIAGESRNSQGLEKTLQNCPRLASHTLPKNIEENLLPHVRRYDEGSIYSNTLNEIDTSGKRKKTPMANLTHRRTHYPITCKLVSDPTTCFLYTSLFYQLTSQHFDNSLPKDSPLISNADRQKFKNLILRISYNGGYSFAKVLLENFLKEIDCSGTNDCIYEEYQARLPLSFEELSKEYVEYVFKQKETWLRNVSNKQSRCNEVRNYISKVEDHMDYLTNETSIKSDWNQQVGKSNEAFEAFQQDVQNECSDHEVSIPSSQIEELFENDDLCSFGHSHT